MSAKRSIETKVPRDPKVPVWLKKAVRLWQRRLRLDHWSVALRITPEPAGDEGNQAAAAINDHLLRGRLEFKPTLTNDQIGHEDIVHELLHMQHYSIDMLFHDVMGMIGNKAVRQTLQDQYTRLLEQHVETMALSFVALAEPMDFPGKPRREQDAKDFVSVRGEDD